MREAVAGAICEHNGNSVCFLFDAWDETPRALQGRSSYLFKFITGISTKKLPHCSIIVTSRPVAAGLLYPHLTAHVNIRGFEAIKLKQFIDASLEDHTARQRLLQQLQEKPQVNDLCSLPINAAIVVHLFRSSPCSILPLTRTGIFEELVSNLLLRHMHLRTVYGLEQWEEKEFEQLPDEVWQEFKSVCDLAYHGVMEDQRIFYLDSLIKLGLAHPSSPLGLMQAQQQLTGFRPRHHYSFLHYVVQEFLAAYHICKLSKEEQTKAVWQILHSTPLSTVLPFYAGLTGLSNEGACGVLLEVTKHPLDRHSVLQSLMHTRHECSDRRRLLLALLHCVYEAQKPSICKLVSPPLNPSFADKLEDLRGAACNPDLFHFLGIVSLFSISFDYLGLDPVDCLSIGYFIVNKCQVSGHLALLQVAFAQCYMGDTEVEILMKYIRQAPSSGPVIGIDLECNTMRHRAIISLTDTLIQTSVPLQMNLNGCLHPAIIDIKSALKYLIEGVSRNSSLKTFSIAFCSLGTAHTYHLALLTAVCNADQLDLSVNNIRTTIPFIAEALKYNRAIHWLSLNYCGISDLELMNLGEALQLNDTLVNLFIQFNPFSSNALTLFLKGLIGTNCNSRLCTLVVEHSLSDEQKRTVAFINGIRMYRSIPQLQITDIPLLLMGALASYSSAQSAPRNIRTRPAFRDSNTDIYL